MIKLTDSNSKAIRITVAAKAGRYDREEGLEVGRKVEREVVALRLLAMDLAEEHIQKATELPIERIRSLKGHPEGDF